MKILYVINSLEEGGAERSLAEMLPHLTKLGVEPLIACLHRRTEGVHEEVVKAGFEVRVLTSRHMAGCARELRQMIREEQPAIVHTTIFEADLIGRFAAWRTSSKVVTSLVNTSYDPVRLEDPNVSKWKLAVAKAIEGWTARHLTDHFHAISEAVKGHAVQHLGLDAEKITTIPRGRDLKRLGEPSPERRRRVREALGISVDQTIILNIGRQEFQKGQRYLLEAIELLADEHPNLLLLHAGPLGNASTELRLRAESRQLAGRVRFLGHRDDVPDLLAAADIFVFPSLYEGLGSTLIEALAMGIPLVVSDLPAAREVAGDGAGTVFVEPGNASACANGLRAVLGDLDEYWAAATRNRDLVATRFRIDHVSSQLADLYRSTVQTHPNPGSGKSTELEQEALS